MIAKYLTTMSEFIRANFSSNNRKYHSIEEFVLKNGKPYTRSDKKVRKRTQKECFRNAYQLAEDKNYIYVEGYAVTKLLSEIGLPVLHSWCLDKKGKVIDPTWDGDGVAYFGVSFNMPYVRKIIFKRKKYGIIDNPEMGFPLLRGTNDKFQI